jgi:Ca2+-transporting ATPase
VAAALTLQFAGLYLPPLADLLGTQPLALPDLLLVCAASTLGYAAIRLDRLIGRPDAARRRSHRIGADPATVGSTPSR